MQKYDDEVSNTQYVHTSGQGLCATWVCSVLIRREDPVFSIFMLPNEDGWFFSGRSWAWTFLLSQLVLGNIMYILWSVREHRWIPTEVCLPKMGLRWNLDAYFRTCRSLYLHLLIPSFCRFVDKKGGIGHSVLDPFLVTIISVTHLFD